jgi:ABC-type transport system substrate-binding protein
MHPRNSNPTTLALILAILLLAGVPTGAAVHGPREDDLEIRFYATQEDAYMALTTGAIDLVLYDLTVAQANNAFVNPNLVTCKVPDSGFYEFDLNNNYSISTYPGIRSPMNYTEMRQAIAFLSDKNLYVDTYLGGMAARIDQMVAAPYYGWANESLSYPYYPYEYSPAAAKVVLDSRFPVGTTPNPYYVAGDPLSSSFLRQYPTDHPQKANQDLDPLIFYVRSDFTPRLYSGIRIYEALQRMGVPVDPTWGPSSVTYMPVMGEFNYHFYTGGWSVGRFPPLSLYGLYHSVNAFAYGPNYVTGAWFDDPAGPGAYQTHPQLDDLLYSANYAANWSDAAKKFKCAVGYTTEICVSVPLWSVASYWGWSNQLLGVVNMQSGDPESGYTFMNAYKADGSPIRCGTINYAVSINVVYANWIYDYNIVDRIYLFGGVSLPAYNAAADQTGFVDEWNVTTWNDGAAVKTKVTMSFREDGYFAKPLSGDQGENVQARHYFFSAWLYYQLIQTFFSSEFDYLHHIDIVGPYDFEIYFDTLSYWNTYHCQGPLLPMDSWTAIGPDFINTTIDTLVNPPTPGAIPLTHDHYEGPIWINYVTWNDVPLTPFTEYNIVLGQLHVYSSLGTGTLAVSYCYVPHGALRGYFPGNLPWQTVVEGAGMYYLTSYTQGVSTTFKRNPFYYLVTPLLGEIDFVKKPSGNYKVDIFDLALAGGAYGSQGTGIPSSNWLPGADLAPAGGVVDLYDLVTITGVHWDREYGPAEP